MAYELQLYVLEDHLHKAVEELTVGLAKFAVIHKIPFEGKRLISAKLVGQSIAQQALLRLVARGIAYNSFGSYGSNMLMSVRFNHMGENLTEYSVDQSELAKTTREYLTYMTWPDGAAFQIAEDRAVVVTMRGDWENQAAYGRRAAMLQLLGN